MKWNDIMDIKNWFTKLGCSLKKNIASDQINWMKIKCIQVRKENPSVLFYKEKWDGEWNQIDVEGNTRKKGKSVSLKTMELNKKFKQRLGITSPKHNDLKTLCNDNIIPNEFHSFYLNLRVATNKRDCLDEPDTQEPDQDDTDRDV